MIKITPHPVKSEIGSDDIDGTPASYNQLDRKQEIDCGEITAEGCGAEHKPADVTSKHGDIGHG